MAAAPLWLSLFLWASVAQGWRLRNPLKRATASQQSSSWQRPQLVQDALAKGEKVYYFGVGSNMLRSKVENRCVDGKGPIEIDSMQPAFVRNYQLAFDVRGFVPLEPAMASIRPVTTPETSKRGQPLLAYAKPECHGSLIHVSAQNYERIMKSEGIHANATNPGYQEVVVQAIPYGPNHQAPVQAIALQARPHVRLQRDGAPSRRYMNILQEGAAELQLERGYQDYLQAHPVQQVPTWLRRVAINNVIFSFCCVPAKLKPVVRAMQSWLLQRLYRPQQQCGWYKRCSDVAMGVILAPGAILGSACRWYWHVTPGASPPPFLGRLLAMLEPSTTASTSSSETALSSSSNSSNSVNTTTTSSSNNDEKTDTAQETTRAAPVKAVPAVSE